MDAKTGLKPFSREPRLPQQAEGPYLVGGSVRDQLLGLEAKDRDWLVVGVAPEEMAAAGFRQVGQQFPVFLHPESGEEYALPRGAVTGLSTRAVVEEDLVRRDLTVNALALSPDGEVFDPCGGLDDLKARRLRHTPHFSQDPLRCLRLIRLCARLSPLGFRIEPETLSLVAEMAASGVLQSLPPERVLGEIEGGLLTPVPHHYVAGLRESGLLGVLLPEVERLFGVPQPAAHHPEVDSGIHTLLALEAAASLSDQFSVRFAVLLHDLGKGLTPAAEWPRHIGHEQRGVEPVRDLGRRLRLPNAVLGLALLAAQYHLLAHRSLELRPSTLLKLFNRCDAFRRPDQFRRFVEVCEADHRGRLGFEQRPYPQAAYLLRQLAECRAIDQRTLLSGCNDPVEIQRRLEQARLRVIAEVKASAR